LDQFEDWRVDFETRAKAIVDEIPVEQMMGMKMNPFARWKVNPDSLDTIMKKSTERILRTHFNIGIIDNPYLNLQTAETIPNNTAQRMAGHEAHLKSVVMLKNRDDIIHRASTAGEKPSVYIPRVYVAATRGWVSTPASAEPGFDVEAAEAYYDVLTDELAETFTEPADEEGNPTLHPDDIIRVSDAEIAQCDFALVRISSPKMVIQLLWNQEV